MRKTVTVQHAAVAAAVLVVAFVTGCGGADPGGIVGPSDTAKTEAGAPDSHGSVAEGGTEPGEAGEEVDGGAGDALPPAPEFIACIANTPAAITVAFGCGAGWSPSYSASSTPTLLAIGDYVVTVHPTNGPPIRCASWDPPVAIAAVCPYVSTGSNPVACDVTAPDGGLIASSTTCAYDFGAQ